MLIIRNFTWKYSLILPKNSHYSLHIHYRIFMHPLSNRTRLPPLSPPQVIDHFPLSVYSAKSTGHIVIIPKFQLSYLCCRYLLIEPMAICICDKRYFSKRFEKILLMLSTTTSRVMCVWTHMSISDIWDAHSLSDLYGFTMNFSDEDTKIIWASIPFLAWIS